jgi:hypothetical protein
VEIPLGVPDRRAALVAAGRMVSDEMTDEHPQPEQTQHDADLANGPAQLTAPQLQRDERADTDQDRSDRARGDPGDMQLRHGLTLNGPIQLPGSATDLR